MGFSTIAIHAGNEPDTATGAVSVPIYQTSTYAQEALGKHKGYEYARTQNPTRLALEKNIAALENAKFGYAFASGMSAIDATLKLVKGGDHVILGDNTYGGTFRLFNKVLSNYGVQFDLADTSNIDDLEKAFKPNTKMVFVETPTNPVMTVTDLAAESPELLRVGRPDVSSRPSIGRRLLRRKSFLLGATALVIIVGAAVFAPLLAPHDPYDQDLDDLQPDEVEGLKGAFDHPRGQIVLA